MPKTDDVIENPITTDRIIFRKTRQDTNGELLQFDNYHKAGGIGPMPHLHPLQEDLPRLFQCKRCRTAPLGEAPDPAF